MKFVFSVVGIFVRMWIGCVVLVGLSVVCGLL